MKTLILVVALSLSTFSTSCLAESSNFQTSSESLRKEIIINFKKVNNGIYRGARLENQNAVEYIKNLGIKNVINLQGGDLNSKFRFIIPWAEPGERPEVIEWEKEASLKLGMGYFHTPLNSLEEVNREEDKAIDETLEFMHNKENQPLFIHCEHGADRTGLLVALYRVKYEGVDVELARAEWIKNGHNTLHQIFTGNLDDYYYEKVKEFKK